MKAPETAYFWYELVYKESRYDSRNHDGYFDTYEEAHTDMLKRLDIHKRKVSLWGDIFEPPKSDVYRMSRSYSSEDELDPEDVELQKKINP